MMHRHIFIYAIGILPLVITLACNRNITDAGRPSDCPEQPRNVYPCPEGAVDLGLNVYWADRYLGAEDVLGEAPFYAWGEIEPDAKGYDWKHYCFMTPGMDDWLGIYAYCIDDHVDDAIWYNEHGFFIGDGIMTLDGSHDIARRTLGGKWRLPTEDEIKELFMKAAAQFTSVDGVPLMRFSRDGAEILLRADGYMSGLDLIGKNESDSFWSSALDRDCTRDALCLKFTCGDITVSSSERCLGRHVIAVYPKYY